MKPLLNISVIFLILLQAGCNFTNTDPEVTVYPVHCKDGMFIDGICYGYLLPLNKSVYKISYQNQSVIYWTPNIFEEPRRLYNCIVRNKNNWSCEYSDKSAKLIMINGKFSEEVKNNSFNNNDSYVSRLRWWYANIFDGKDLYKNKILRLLDNLF